MPNKESIPASLRIGGSAAPRHEVPFDVLLRGINSNYGEWITNSPHCDPNDTRNLIISMKVALERMQQERDEARREVCGFHHLTGLGFLAGDYAKRRGWDCFKEDTHD